MKKKILIIIIAVIILAIAIFIILNNTNIQNITDSNIEENTNIENSIETENTVLNNENNIQEGEKLSMKILLNNKEYEVKLDNNETVNDITKNMPLKLDLVRFAGHEYYSELPFRPIKDREITSNIKAGHVYYWDGWNAFVINYIDSDITPYQVVHVGEIVDSSIIDVLTNANENISIEVTK